MDEMEYIAHNSEQAALSHNRAQHGGSGAGAGIGGGAGPGAAQSQTQSAHQTQPQPLYQSLNQSQQPQISGCPYYRGAENPGHLPNFHHNPSQLPLPPQHPQFPQHQHQHPILNPHQAPGQSHPQPQSQIQNHGFLSQPHTRNPSSHHSAVHLHYDPVHAANSNNNWYSDIPWSGTAIPPYPITHHHHHSRTASSDTYFNTLGHPQGPGPASLGVPGLGLLHSQGPQHHLSQHEQFAFYRNLPPNVPRYPGITNPNLSNTTANSTPPNPELQQQPPPSLAAGRGINLPTPNPPPPPPLHQFNMSGSGEPSPDLSGNRRPMMIGNMADSMRGSNRNENGARATDLPPSPPMTTSLSSEPEPLRPEVAAPSRSDQSGLPTSSLGSNMPRRRAYPGRAAMYAMNASDYDTDDELELEDEQQALRFIEQYGLSGNFPRDMGEAQVRAHQLLRGQIPNKRVASKKALSQLQSVDIDSLEESERTCVICYNEFGVETPEGINEAPLRLPGCKHIFGDHCIKKWFEESDSCPYCRDKVPSEPLIPRTAQYLRELYGQFPSRDPARRMPFNEPAGLRNYDRRDDSRLESSPPRGSQTGDRRSPPSEASESRRRTRPRHFRGSPSIAASHRHGASQTAGSSSTAPVHPGPARERLTNPRPLQPTGSNTTRFSMPLMPQMPTMPTAYQSRELSIPTMPPFPDPLGLNGQPSMHQHVAAYQNIPLPNGTAAISQPYPAPGPGSLGAPAMASGGELLPGPAQLDAYSQQLPSNTSLPPVVASETVMPGNAINNGTTPTALRFTRTFDGSYAQMNR